MINFTKSLAKQPGPKGIRVNGVAPGPITTPRQMSGRATQEKLRQFGGKTRWAAADSLRNARRSSSRQGKRFAALAARRLSLDGRSPRSGG